MFQGNLGGVFQLRRCSAQHLGEACRGHRARRPHLALATHLGTGDRCILLAQDADSGSGQQERHHIVVTGSWVEFHVVVQHRRDDARRAVGRRRDHAPASGVLFIDRQGEQVHPLHGTQGRADHIGFAQFLQAAMQTCSAALDAKPARQDALIAQAVVDAFTHRRPYPQQPCAHLGFRAPRAFVGQHQLGNAQLVGLAQRQQLGGTGEFVGQRDCSRLVLGRVDFTLLDNKAATNGVVGLAEQAALLVHCLQGHGIGVVRQVFLQQQHVACIDESQRVAGVEHQALLLHHLANA
ncbi:hypothetical protein D3C78_362610 [compost metagenome]